MDFGENKSDDSEVRDQTILLRLSWYVDGVCGLVYKRKVLQQGRGLSKAGCNFAMLPRGQSDHRLIRTRRLGKHQTLKIRLGDIDASFHNVVRSRWYVIEEHE